jgi:hypothetical protein
MSPCGMSSLKMQQPLSQREWWTAYARVENAMDFILCGWVTGEGMGLQESPHGNWSVLMERPACECGRVPNPQRKT